jgi:hypothetical protein
MSKMWDNASNRSYKKVLQLVDRFIFQSQAIVSQETGIIK